MVVNHQLERLKKLKLVKRNNMARIPKAQKGYCTKGGNCRLVATGKFRGNESATGSGRLTKSERKELKHEEKQEKIYGPDNLIRSPRSEFRQYPMNWKGRSSTKSTTSSSAKTGKTIKKAKNGGSTPAWTRSEGKDPKGGLNRKGVASYRAANPGSKLKMAVTTKPSKLKAGSEPAKRRKSFCARMSGVKGPMRKNGKPTRKALALKKWNC